MKKTDDTLKQIEREMRKRRIKENLKEKANKTIDFAKEHKELLIAAVPLVGVATKAVLTHSKLHKEQDLKDLYCYDRSLGHYWKLRRKLSTREWSEIDRRKQNGERLGEILESMGVLK